ncbi:hypothetical protein B0T09DRAFT_68461 [Sordaria sp. MPI-SDFR-AT-0083]|nr:hypothetical protein B0T09DRAFT_68461 [Sordaria sp. MPI-SDFR-AT-0083]
MPSAIKPPETKSLGQLYTYQTLENPGHIRAVTLLPGDFDEDFYDDIIIHISCASMRVSQANATSQTRMTLQEVTAALPPGWTVGETWDNRYIFGRVDHGRRDERFSQKCWSHPDRRLHI